MLAILTVFLSAFLTIAVPAYKTAKESERDDLLLSDIFIFMEYRDFSSQTIQKIFHSDYAVLRVDENSGGFLFAADISVPPETASFLKYDEKCNGFENFDEKLAPLFLSSFSPDSEFYFLSFGSLLFSCRYSQIPDRSYFLGDSSLLLLQKDGSAFLIPPNISIRKSNDRILLSMSGDIVKSDSSPISGNSTILESRVLQKAEIHDFVSLLAIQYVPPNSNSVLSDHEKEQKKEAVFSHFSDLNDEIRSRFPELTSEWDHENMILMISSESAFELDCTIREIEYSFS